MMTERGCPLAFVLGCLLGPPVCILQMIGCFALTGDYWGWPWYVSISAMTVLLLFRLGWLLLSVGCFFGALLVWDWPWWGAVLLAAPEIVLVALMELGNIGGAVASPISSMLQRSNGSDWEF